MDVKTMNHALGEESVHSIPTSVTFSISPQKTEKIAWRMCKFTNPARSDNLVLSHWQRINVSSDATKNDGVLPVYDEQNAVTHEYRFSKFNPVIKVYTFTDDFYNNHLKDEMGDWSRSDVDYLIDLCEAFELKFVIIHDKLNQRFPVTIEQVKQKYYFIAKKVNEHAFDEKIRLEASKHKSLSHPNIVSLKEERNRHPMIKYTYNYEQDKERRAMLDRQYRITPEARQKEADLVDEITKLELKIKKEEKKPFEIKRLKKKFGVNHDDIIPTVSLDSVRPSKGASLANMCVLNHKSKLTPKNDEAIKQILESMNILPPTVSTLSANELYCLIRSDAAMLHNIRNKVDSLTKELEHWKAIAASAENNFMQMPPVHQPGFPPSAPIPGMDGGFPQMSQALPQLIIKPPEPAFDYQYLMRGDPTRAEPPRPDVKVPDIDTSPPALGFFPSPSQRPHPPVYPQSPVQNVFHPMPVPSSQPGTPTQHPPTKSQKSSQSQSHMSFQPSPTMHASYNVSNGMNMQQQFMQPMYQNRMPKMSPARPPPMMMTQNRLSPTNLPYHIQPNPMIKARPMQHMQGPQFAGKMPPMHMQQQFMHPYIQSPKIMQPNHMQPQYVPPLNLPPSNMPQSPFHSHNQHMQFSNYQNNFFSAPNFHPSNQRGNIAPMFQGNMPPSNDQTGPGMPKNQNPN